MKSVLFTRILSSFCLAPSYYISQGCRVYNLVRILRIHRSVMQKQADYAMNTGMQEADHPSLQF